MTSQESATTQQPVTLSEDEISTIQRCQINKWPQHAQDEFENLSKTIRGIMSPKIIPDWQKASKIRGSGRINTGALEAKDDMQLFLRSNANTNRNHLALFYRVCKTQTDSRAIAVVETIEASFLHPLFIRNDI
jgi:hypothetical protein